ncbi:hypothetical protein MKW98_000642 [Papaver atlanticum]|uniref:Uncharacterized protein n=1 Tax=Papaver atlanticum TaxID=357466 RepID=A0AAD4T3Z4_9MAGN|nr:hypothetical protein MKW98_000642 [Papaver atlanticum]
MLNTTTYLHARPSRCCYIYFRFGYIHCTASKQYIIQLIPQGVRGIYPSTFSNSQSGQTILILYQREHVLAAGALVYWCRDGVGDFEISFNRKLYSEHVVPCWS